MSQPGRHHEGVDPRSCSRGARITRRRALELGGLFGLAGALAACGSSADGDPAAGGSAAADADPAALLAQAPRCVLTAEETQGPYWFDVDAMRSDIRDDRAGIPLRLALRVQDLARCTADPADGGMPGAVVEIWHCDAMGVYSGFRNGFAAPGPDGPPQGSPPPGSPPQGSPPPGPPPQGSPPDGPPPGVDSGGAPTSGPVSDGSYSAGDIESAPSGDATFLRGAQTADAQGTVRFTSIYPGWYTGRAVHIHIKVHLDRKTVLTTQLYFDDALSDELYASTVPYSQRGARDTRNHADTIFDETGLSAARRAGDGVIAALNLGVRI